MRPRKTFADLIAEGYQMMLPLPEPPKVNARFSECSECGMRHRTDRDDIRCLQAQLQVDAKYA